MQDKPLGYWRFEEDRQVASSFANSGTESDVGLFLESTQLGEPGIAGGKAIKIDEHNEVAWPSGSTYQFVGKAPFSVELWVKLEEISADRRRLLSAFNSPLGDGWILEYNTPEAHSLRIMRYLNQGSDSALRKPPELLSWAHVVATYDSSELCLYLNAGPPFCLPSDREIRDHSSYLVAAQPPPTAPKAWIDELAIYDYALAPARIASHHAAGK